MSRRYTMSRGTDRSNSAGYETGSPSAFSRAREYFAKGGPFQSATDAPAASVVSFNFDSADAAGRLPEPARSKFLDMRQTARDLNVASNALREQMEGTRDVKQRSEATVRQLLAGGGVGGFDNTTSSPAVKMEQTKCVQYSEELSRLQGFYDDRTDRWRAVAAIVATIERYLKSCGTIRLAASTPEAKTGRSDSYASAIDKVRSKISALKEDRQAVLDAPIPSGRAKEMARAQIEALADRGRVDVMPLIESSQPLLFPTTSGGIVRVEGMAGETAGSITMSSTFDAEAMFAWLHRDALVSAINREIDVNSDDASALDADQRAKKMAQVKAAILAAERDEEALIEAAHAVHIPIARRHDADPRAVMGLADDMPEPRSI